MANSNKTLLHPQEIEVYYVLPTLRRQIALALKEKGMKQKDIALLFGTTTATISQYISKKRGDLVHLDPAMVREIKLATSRIQDRLSYFRETQRLLQHIRNTDTLCEIHKQFTNVPLGCEPSTIGCHHQRSAHQDTISVQDIN